MRYQGNKKVKVKWGRFIVVLLVLALVIFGAIKLVPALLKPNKPSNTANNTNNTNNAHSVTPDPTPTPPTEPETVSIRIRCAGDVMVHAGNPRNQLENALRPDGSYDFSHTFAVLGNWLGDADISMAQFETTFSGLEDYRGYPGFSTPEVLAKNVRDTGVNVALFANNHMLDSRLSGAINTVKVLREHGFKAVCGARMDPSESRSQIVEVKGLKVGFVAWTYETALVDGRRTMNGTHMDNDAPNYINSFRYETGADGQYHVMEEDRNAIKAEIDWCRAQGAEVVICYFHWGTEYVFEPDFADAELAKFAAENGADIVFGGHPHVIQPIEMVNGVPVFYSLGNFVSNQRYETLTGYHGFPEIQSRRTEQGLIANIELTYNKTTKKITYDNVSAIPTWVNLFTKDGKWIHQIVPLLDNLDADEGLQISGCVQRAKDALADVTQFLGEEYIYKEH